MLTLTTNHAASSYGRPVFVQGRSLLDDADGIRALRSQLGLTAAQLAEQLGLSRRTVEGWEIGRRAHTRHLYAMQAMLPRA